MFFSVMNFFKQLFQMQTQIFNFLKAGNATHLPPMNGSLQPKKKTAKHCFFCGKKTGLATSYECR